KNKKVADIFCVLQDILDFYRRYGFYEQFEKELEYFCTKILFCSSLSRIGRVKDAALEKELLDRTFCFVS
ncbi:glycosyl transferase family 2, partial [Blautia producta]